MLNAHQGAALVYQVLDELVERTALLTQQILLVSGAAPSAV